MCILYDLVLHLKATYIGPHEKISQAHTLVQNYMKAHDFELTAPVWEVYLVSYDKTSNPDEFETIIYYPVRQTTQ